MNTDIPFGRENKSRKSKYRKFNEPYENAFAYSGIFANVKIHNTTKDNTKWAYNGEGVSYKGNKVRIPSVKRSNKVWRNFYTLFPEYYEILQKCLRNEMKHIRINNCVCIKMLKQASYLNGNNFYHLIKLKNVEI